MKGQRLFAEIAQARNEDAAIAEALYEYLTSTTRPVSYERDEKRRQKVLLTGMDCLAGQKDLFST